MFFQLNFCTGTEHLFNRNRVLFLFFFIRVFFHGHGQLTGQRGREGTILFHSTTSTRSRTFRHLFANWHVRWLSHTFNRSTSIYQIATRWDFTTLSNYYLIDWWCNFDFYLFACWIDCEFCYSYMAWETSGLELASTIILVLQANRLTKCASHASVRHFYKEKLMAIM